MPSVDQSVRRKFADFMHGLSTAEQKAVVPYMAQWVALAGPAAEVMYRAASTDDDMDAYVALRQPRRGP
jgi:hypothetical protein